MYNLNLNENEEIIITKDDVIVYDEDNSKNLSVVLTNQRILFLDNLDEVSETLRISKGIDYFKELDVIYQILITDIVRIEDEKIMKNDNNTICINNQGILNALKSIIK